MSRDEYVHEVEKAKAIAETTDGLLVTSPNLPIDPRSKKRQAWVPKKFIHDDSEVYKIDTEGTLIVTQWLAEQRGWV